MGFDTYLGVLAAGEFHSISSEKVTIPIGQLVLATSIRRALREHVRAAVLNSATLDDVRAALAEMDARPSSTLVGLSWLTSNVQASEEIANWLSTEGYAVAVGGPEVTATYFQHGLSPFKARRHLYAVVIGPGENVLPWLMLSKPEPGLVSPIICGWDASSREPRVFSESVSFYHAPEFDFRQAAVDYSLLMGIERMSGVSYLWRLDCAQATNRCYFCGRLPFGAGVRDPAQVWDEIRQAVALVPQLGLLYNVADSVGVGQRTRCEETDDWVAADLRHFVECQPPELATGGLRHRLFINARDVTPSNARLIGDLRGIAAVGLESLVLLHQVGKVSTDAQINERALETLASEKHVSLALSFVLGLPEETEETLEENVSYVKTLAERYREKIHSIEVSPLTVTTGSKAYSDLMEERGLAFEKRLVPPYPPVPLMEEYFNIKTKLTRGRVLQSIAELARELKRKGICVDVKGVTRDEAEQLELSGGSSSNAA